MPSLLYSTSAQLGGTGLDVSSLQGATAAWQAGLLTQAIAYGQRQNVIPADRVRSLRWHPVRLLSGLGSTRYYGAKKRYLDWIASRELEKGAYDLFHSWTGDCLNSLLIAKARGIRSAIDIATWHRNKGHDKPFETKSERDARRAPGWRARLAQLPPSRQRILLEYELADLIFTPSTFSHQTFLDQGIPESRLHYVARGVDLSKFKPSTTRPEIFRAIFAGALIQRKGVHLLLEAWKKLALPPHLAELHLIGPVHEELQPALREWATDSVKVRGFSTTLHQDLAQGSVFVFPTECEGFAKVTIEAAACGLPLITTAESGDALVPDHTGYQIRPHSIDDLCTTLRHAFDHQNTLAQLGKSAREHVVKNFSWEHYHARVKSGYRRLLD